MLNVWVLCQLPQLLTSWRLQAKAARKAKRKAAERKAARRAEQQQLRIAKDADENAAATPPDAFGETRAVDAAEQAHNAMGVAADLAAPKPRLKRRLREADEQAAGPAAGPSTEKRAHATAAAPASGSKVSALRSRQPAAPDTQQPAAAAACDMCSCLGLTCKRMLCVISRLTVVRQLPEGC